MEFVNSLAETLRGKGIEVWLDVSGSGTGIPFSTKWFSVIEEALHMSSGAIIVATENWKNSGPCKKEYDIIKKCDIPFFEITPLSMKTDIDSLCVEIRTFISEQVDTQTNSIRTTLFASAYEYKVGVNPYQIINNTKGILSSFFYITNEYRRSKKLLRDRQYEKSNPELFPYLKKFLGFLKRTLLIKMATGIALLLAVVTAIIFIRAIPMALQEASKYNQNTYSGQYAAARISEVEAKDPIKAIRMAEKLGDDYLTITSFFSLSVGAARLMDSKLPDKVLIHNGDEYDSIQTAETIDRSAFFDAASSNAGGIIITEISTGKKQYVNTSAVVQRLAWSEDGTILAFSTGANVYIYDAVGKGEPVFLSENYEQVSQLKFLDINGALHVAAVTERDTAVLWESPFNNRSNPVRTTNYGIFLSNDNPTVVYVDGRDVIIHNDQQERIIHNVIPEEYGKIVSPYYAVSSDGSKIAFICENNGSTRIICLDLNSEQIMVDLLTDYYASSVTFSTDGEEIVASARKCAIIRIDLTDGSAEYGQYDNLYFANIIPFGTYYLLTDYNGICCVFDKMVMIKDMGIVNYMNFPVFSLAVNEEAGYLFTVNRGASTTRGCSRFNLKSGGINLFVVPELSNVDANTAVALSENGAYVAFGYPNGTVRIYDQEHMYLLFERNCVGESISALHFRSDNSALYILGSTGNVYSCQLPDFIIPRNLNSMKANWKAAVHRLSGMKKEYYDGIITGD